MLRSVAHTWVTSHAKKKGTKKTRPESSRKKFVNAPKGKPKASCGGRKTLWDNVYGGNSARHPTTNDKREDR